MNNRFFSLLLCVTVLALAPACTKKSRKTIPQDEIKKTIELDTTIFEIEESDNDQKSNAKF